MDEGSSEIPFNPQDREHIPAEVLASLPPGEADSILDAMEGEAIYRRGPAASDIDLVRYHDSNRPTTPDRPTWHVPREQADNYTLIASSREMQHAIDGAGVDVHVLDEARNYARGPGSSTDIAEGLALPGRFGPRNAESHLHVPKGAYVVTIESRVAPQAGGPDPMRAYSANGLPSDRDDNRVGPNEYGGGNRQVLVLTYDADKCKVTPRAKSVDLRNDNQARQAAALERMRSAAQRDDNEAWDRAKADYEKAVDEERTLHESTDRGMSGRSY